jgi:hypothetical protein
VEFFCQFCPRFFPRKIYRKVKTSYAGKERLFEFNQFWHHKGIEDLKKDLYEYEVQERFSYPDINCPIPKQDPTIATYVPSSS